MSLEKMQTTPALRPPLLGLIFPLIFNLNINFILSAIDSVDKMAFKCETKGIHIDWL